MIRAAGRPQAWSPSQTSMQREVAEAPFERVGERWWVSLLLWVAILAVAAVAWAVL